MTGARAATEHGSLSGVNEAPAGPLALSDSRAYELVSPPDKHGAPIEALTREGGLILAAEDDNSITYVADGAFVEQPQGNRSPEMQQVLSTRSPEGWSSQDIATPNTGAQGYQVGAPQEYQFFTPDLSVALVEPYGATPTSEPPLAPGATQKTIYLRNNQTGTYLPLVSEANVPAGTAFGKRIHFNTATPDLSHVVLHSEVALTPAPSGPGLYAWTAGKLQFLSLVPAVKETSCAQTCIPSAVSTLGFGNHLIAHTISNDGSRVIFDNGSEGAFPAHLYLRDTAKGETLQLDAAQGVSEPPGSGAARFQSASSDGSKVFFTDTQRLTPDSTAEPTGEPTKADLYECEVTEAEGRLTCRLKDLTVPDNPGEHASAQGLLFGTSEDGATVYLVAQGVLAANANGDGATAQPGKDNLYMLRQAAGEWTTAFIATLSSEDAPQWQGNNGSGDSAFVTARVSPDGRYLAFMSNASLTGYDNTDQQSAKPDEEVYLYDAATASLVCASCNPSGARPAGVLDTEEAGEGRGLLVDRRKVWAEHWLAGSIPGWTAQSLTTALFQPRYLSDTGRLFFNSPDHLLPAASDGKENVYEYEPTGVGSCQSATGACVSLISSGTSDRESAFLEATPSGDDVFFLTAAQLLAQDTDTTFDVYDARVCTAQSPCVNPGRSGSGDCESAETCRAAPPAVPAPVGPSGTATLTGPGNTTTQPPAAKVVPQSGKPKPLTRAQKLARALKACAKLRHTDKRHACIRRAHRAYGARRPASRARRTRRGARR